MSTVSFTVNGDKCYVNECTPRETSLNAYLRYELHLPGTKAMCHEGGCGSCIVSVKARHPVTGDMEIFSVNSCLVLVFSCHEWEITTVEGLGNRRDGYHPIQKRIRSFNATQCGYCTPGWVMHMYSLLNKNLTMDELEKSFGSNTCRCTGYRPILDTMKSFAVDANPKLMAIADIEDLESTLKCLRKCSVKSDESDWSIINDETVNEIHLEKNNIEIKFNPFKKFFKVYRLKEIFQILKREGFNSYMFVAGNTGKGLMENYEYPNIIIDINDIKVLKKHLIDQNIILGANMTLEDTRLLFKELAGTTNGFQYLEEFARHIELIAHIPVRQIGTLAGNLMLKHKMPIYQSDLFVLFESVGGMVSMESSNGNKKTMSLTDFLEYDVSNQIMTEIILPPLSKSHIIKTYKIMPRNQNALAIVNAAFSLKLNKNKVIEEASIVYGNIRPDFVHAVKTETYLVGKSMNNNVLQGAVNVLKSEIKPLNDPSDESPEARKKLAIGLFYKFILNISPVGIPSSRLRSGGQLMERPVSQGIQDFQTDENLYPLNEPTHKLEAFIQCSGEAQYVNDMPNFPNQVFGAFVLSTIHSGEIDNIDANTILKIDGVRSLFTAKDIPGKNSWTRVGIPTQDEDETVLAEEKISYYGQPLAIVVANSQSLAELVAKKVKVTYKNVTSNPPVLTIDEAKKDSRRVKKFDKTVEPKGKGKNVTKVIKGVYEIEAQYHYYIEPMTAVVVPVDNLLEVYSSVHWLDLTQIVIADFLAIKQSDVLVKLRRIGGSFGGKLSRTSQISAACALVAKKLNVPCRFILPLTTNLSMMGKRLPCQSEYEVGVDDDGKIQYLEMNITNDNGYSHNENVLDYVIGGIKNGYNSDFWSVKACSVLTDLPSNTFMRGPGTTEAIASIEHVMNHIAFEVKKDPTDVRLVNMRDDNDLAELVPLFKKEAEYDRRAKEIKQFNRANRWIKKAISLNVMLFPIHYTGNYSALVSIYRGDGTVTVSTGGNEMGQGINTKLAQVCAYTLGIPLDYVTIIPNYSFTSANNIYTGGSLASESVSFAIVKACEILLKRLQPVKDKMPNAKWKDLIFKAGKEMIDMTASYMMTENEPELKPYNAYAVAIFEVQLDVLLGRYEILRTDILEDVGISVNPGIDVGQVEGGFVQGIGYYTSEKLRFDKKTGKLLTNRSLNYHVPLARDIPIDFRVKLRYNSKNPKGVLNAKVNSFIMNSRREHHEGEKIILNHLLQYCSGSDCCFDIQKSFLITVGEMGVCTGNGINQAVRKCIQESRIESGYDRETWINIDIPYTTESVLKALDVKLNEFVITQN